ncbi:MAG: hypothetical protein JWQ49_6400 [Edaphobacter sp.]|nr:hypothetical protein [Edaphobacter sp.]
MRKLLCLLTLLVFATPLFAADPFAGTWKLNTAKTKYTTGTPPKEITLVIEEQGPNLLVTATGTNSDGSPISVKYTVPISGGAGSMQEGDNSGITSKQISANVRENSYSKDGKELRTRHMVVSKDGKTMTSKVKGTNPNGKPVDGTDVYDKQ